MHQVNLKARKRVKSGKEECKKFRRAGLIPGIIYGKGFDNTMVALDALELKKALSTSGGIRVILNLELEGDGKTENYATMVADIQKDVFQKGFNHIDLQRIYLDKPVRTDIPVTLLGEPKGVKIGGGMMDQIIRTISVEGLPLDIPESVKVDVTNMVEKDQLYVKNLPVTDKVQVLNDGDECVAIVHPPRVATEGAAGAEGAAAETGAAKA